MAGLQTGVFPCMGDLTRHLDFRAHDRFLAADFDSAGLAVMRKSTSSRAMRSGVATASQVLDFSAPLQELADEESKKKKKKPASST